MKGTSTMAHPTKKHHEQIISIRSITYGKGDDGFGTVLTGMYTHRAGQSSFAFKVDGRDTLEILMRSEWHIISSKAAIWIQGYRDHIKELTTNNDMSIQRRQYLEGYADCLLHVSRHLLMD